MGPLDKDADSHLSHAKVSGALSYAVVGGLGLILALLSCQMDTIFKAQVYSTKNEPCRLK